MNNSVFNQCKGKFHLGTGTSHDAAQDDSPVWGTWPWESLCSSGHQQFWWSWTSPSQGLRISASIKRNMQRQQPLSHQNSPASSPANHISPWETQNDCLWTPEFFWSQIHTECGDPDGKVMVCQAGGSWGPADLFQEGEAALCFSAWTCPAANLSRST